MGLTSRSKYILGVSLLICVVLLWVGSSFLMSLLFNQHDPDANGRQRPIYDKPFAVTFLNTGTFVLYLIPTFLSSVKSRLLPWFKHAFPDKIAGHKYGTLVEDQDPDELDMSTEDVIMEEADNFERPSGLDTYLRPTHARSDSYYSVRTRTDLVRLAGMFCFLWFSANWSMNAALKYTDVGIVTVLSNLSGMFTLTFGIIWGVEVMDWRKVVAVFLSLIGVILISILDSGKPLPDPLLADRAWLGDILAIAGAALYGLYTTLLKAAVPDETVLDEKAFLGLVGLLNCCFLWPVFFILHFTHVESFQWPQLANTWILVLVNALLGTCLADYLWLKALILTTPILVTLGLSLSIPLAIIGDVVLGSQAARQKIGVQYLFGAAAITSSFLLVNSLEHKRSVQADSMNNSSDDAEEDTPVT